MSCKRTKSLGLEGRIDTPLDLGGALISPRKSIWIESAPEPSLTVALDPRYRIM